MLVREKCDQCKGDGHLPPLGDCGDKSDVKRFFPRPCDKCHGSGAMLVGAQITEVAKQQTSEASCG